MIPPLLDKIGLEPSSHQSIPAPELFKGHLVNIRFSRASDAGRPTVGILHRHPGNARRPGILATDDHYEMGVVSKPIPVVVPDNPGAYRLVKNVDLPLKVREQNLAVQELLELGLPSQGRPQAEFDITLVRRRTAIHGSSERRSCDIALAFGRQGRWILFHSRSNGDPA